MTDPSNERPEEEAPERTETMIRYTGTSNERSLSRRDLSGDPAASDATGLVWQGNGAELPWADWVDAAGSPERAAEILAVNSSEFLVIGVDGEVVSVVPEEDEFAIGGPVE